VSRSDGPLRIGIEAHVIHRRPSGNGRVVANLAAALRRGTEHHLFLYFTDRETATHWRARHAPRTTIRTVRPRNPAIRIPFGLPLLAARDRLDVFLAHANAPPLTPCPVVTLVHDVAFARHPEFFSPFERAWMTRTIPASMRRSAGVVTVSEFTRSEIVELYGIPERRIAVAHNGVDPIFLETPAGPPDVEPPFFLAVGNLQPRKNLATLIAGYRGLIARRPELPERLVIVGAPAYDADRILREASDLRASGRAVFPGYVPDSELVALLHHATAFAYPSVYEGFGLPPLEAMAAGAPAIVADIPVMREVTGDAALRVPPLDTGAWERALERVSSDERLRTDLRARGTKRAASFTWEAAADAVAGSLETAARRRKRRS
jgi:glycosyltransferase involved in cell wall biosynthesis